MYGYQSTSWVLHIANYTVLTRPNEFEKAVHGCNSWLSVWTLMSLPLIRSLQILRKQAAFSFAVLCTIYVCRKVPFLDVLINNETHFPVTSVYCKKTFTVLLTNFFSFISHSYKLDPIRTLVDRATLGSVFTTTSRNLPKSFIIIFF